MPTKLESSTKSAVIAFEPRQVTLAKQNMAKKVYSETSGIDSTGKTLTVEQKLKKSKKKKSMNSSDKALLFHSIAAYLDVNGFSKTLSAFRSEALSEIDDWKGHAFDLEEMCNKYLESRYHVEANVNHLMEPETADLRKDGATEKVEGGSNFDVFESEELTKKKRKKNNEGDANSLSVKVVVENGFAKCVDDVDRKLADEVSNHIRVQSKEKMEKHKLEVSEEPADVTSHELQSDELNKSRKDKKKKKSKSIPRSDPEDIEQSQSKTSCEAIKEKSKILKSSKDKCKIDATGLDAADVQSKGKKKSKAISDTFLENTEHVVLKDVQEVGKRKPEDLESSRGENGAPSVTKLDADETSGLVPLDEKNVKSKDKKKKKERLASESRCFEGKNEFDQGDSKKIDFIKENLQTKGDNGVNILNKSSKKRKRLVSEETKSQWDEETEVKEAQLRKDEGLEEGKESQQHPKEAASTETDGNATKKRKTQNGHIDSKNSQEMSVDNELGGLASRNFEKDGREQSTSEKMIKKQRNGLAEPKTVNAFQRVKVEEVKFVDERLQDNSYWGKDGADIGYGAKAQEVLGQVRGRDFRHEKTKKKRGSYRGGQIDLQSHSVKFNYSDDE